MAGAAPCHAQNHCPVLKGLQGCLEGTRGQVYPRPLESTWRPGGGKLAPLHSLGRAPSHVPPGLELQCRWGLRHPGTDGHLPPGERTLHILLFSSGAEAVPPRGRCGIPGWRLVLPASPLSAGLLLLGSPMVKRRSWTTRAKAGPGHPGQTLSTLGLRLLVKDNSNNHQCHRWGTSHHLWPQHPTEHPKGDP